jgi:CRISPR type III-A-associated RAMP protein Csm4
MDTRPDDTRPDDTQPDEVPAGSQPDTGAETPEHPEAPGAVHPEETQPAAQPDEAPADAAGEAPEPDTLPEATEAQADTGTEAPAQPEEQPTTDAATEAPEGAREIDPVAANSGEGVAVAGSQPTGHSKDAATTDAATETPEVAGEIDPVAAHSGEGVAAEGSEPPANSEDAPTIPAEEKQPVKAEDAQPVKAQQGRPQPAKAKPVKAGPPALVVRLRPTGPWRFGPISGARDRVDRIYHSDSLFSALSNSMLRLGLLEEWLAATVSTADEPQVRISSCYPRVRDALYVIPPRNVWPPPASARIRWKGARFIPISLVSQLLNDQPLKEESWAVDGASECLMPIDRGNASPFRMSLRTNAAVDRLHGEVLPHSTACLEFAQDAGLWFAVVFADTAAREKWGNSIRAAVRLLADSGFGGERSRGWGRSESPSFSEGAFPDILLPRKPRPEETDAEAPPAVHPEGWWLLSLFSPAESDSVDWNKGRYSLVTRGGRVESVSGWGANKRLTRMVAEGSVLVASSAPRGAAPNVAPEEFPHPVYRSGVALAIPIPLKGAAS